MNTYRVTAWKAPVHWAMVEIEAESAEQALAAGRQHNWDDEPFEDCGESGAVDFIRAEDQEDTEAAEADLFPLQNGVKTAKLLAAAKAAWHFIENVGDDDPERTDKFFALREQMRETLAEFPEEG